MTLLPQYQKSWIEIDTITLLPYQCKKRSWQRISFGASDISDTNLGSLVTSSRWRPTLLSVPPPEVSQILAQGLNLNMSKVENILHLCTQVVVDRRTKAEHLKRFYCAWKSTVIFQGTLSQNQICEQSHQMKLMNTKAVSSRILVKIAKKLTFEQSPQKIV